MNRVEIVQAGAQLAALLAGLAQKQDVNLLLTPDNVVIGETGVGLRSQTPPEGARIGVYPGFSAPEVHAGAPGANSGVYYVGAVLYTLVAGSPPPPAPARQPGPVFTDGKLLSQVINQALELNPQQRFAGFAPLEGALKAVLAQAQIPAAPPPAPVPPPPAQTAPAQEAGPVPPQTAPPQAGAPVPPPPPQAAAPVPPPPPQAQASVVPPPASGKAQAYAAPGQPPAAPGMASPYAAGPPQGMPPPLPLPTPPKKKKKTGLIIGLSVAAAVVLAVGGLLVYTFMQKGEADKAYTEQRYTDYVNTVDSLPWMNLFMGGEADLQYANAKVHKLMESSESTAQEVLDAITALDAIENSGPLVRTARDAWVNTLLRSDRYEEALQVTDSLQPAYPDSADLAKEVRYQWAQDMIDLGQYDEALDMLDELGSYKDSLSLAQPIRYDWAISLMHDGDLQASLAMFEQVGDYLDSYEQADNINSYLYASEQTDPAARYYAFRDLGGFLDAAEQADTAAAGIYNSGVQYYQEQQFDQAYELLNIVYDYGNTGQYIEAMDVYYGSADGEPDAYYNIEALRGVSYDIDVRPVVMTNRVLWGFLIGDWESYDGGGAFSITSTNFGFDEFDHEGTYIFENGKTLTPSEGQDSPVFYFEYIDFDHIYINVTSTGETYEFERL